MTQQQKKYTYEVSENFLSIFNNNDRLIIKTRIDERMRNGMKKMFQDNSSSYSSGSLDYKVMNNDLIITAEGCYPINIPFNNNFINAILG